MKTKSTIAVLSTAFLILGIVANSVADETEKTVRFQGTYCDGAGDVAWLQLIDERAVMLPRSGQGSEADANVAWGGVPIDNESNLLKNHVTRVTTDGNMLFGSSLKNINDGKLISNGDIAESTANLSVFSAGSHLVFQLDATYLIDRIDIFTVHAQRNGQSYSVDTSADGGLTWTPLTTVSKDNIAGVWKVRRIRLFGRNGATLTTGVNALRFNIHIPGGEPPYDTYDSVYGEIAAYAIPNPGNTGIRR